MRRFRHCQSPGDIGLAASDAELWGYPRPIHPNELEVSGWWRFGPDCILWIQMIPTMKMTGVLHICVAPSARLKHLVGARRLFQGIDILADLYCLERLLANDCVEGGPVAGYLERLGWELASFDGLEDEYFVKEYPPFGGGEDVRTAETEGHSAHAEG